jgi:hypothetical protein
VFTIVGFSGGAAQAAFSIAELQQATKLASDTFEAEHRDHVDHFVGFKSWKSGEDSKVKIYVTHDGMNMEFNYLCHKHDDKVECHVQ